MAADRHNLNAEKDAQPGGSQPPVWAGIRLGRPLAAGLYVVLVLSAVLALWLHSAPGAAPPQISVAAPWVFLGFVAVFAFYRIGLVRARRYPAFKAFVQVGAGVLFFMLLLPQWQLTFRHHESTAAELLADPNPKVRALAAEVVRYHRDMRAAHLLVDALRDPDPAVREEAHRSLVALSGMDLGPPSDPKAVEAWGARFP